LEKIVRSQLEIDGSKLGFGITFISLDGKTASLLFEDKLIEIHAFPLKHRILTNGFLIKEKTKEYTLLGEVFHAEGLSRTFIPKFKNGEDVIDENGITHYFKDYTTKPSPTKSYAYCSDTVYYEKVIPYIEGVNLLYHEATFTEPFKSRAKATFHSTAKDAAIIAQKANVKKLILGHLSARFENGNEHQMEAREIFENVEVVEDGNVYEI
jgi:ribonuclease Z